MNIKKISKISFVLILSLVLVGFSNMSAAQNCNAENLNISTEEDKALYYASSDIISAVNIYNSTSKNKAVLSYGNDQILSSSSPYQLTRYIGEAD